MEAHIKALVGSYLTRGGSVFVSPQFNIPWDEQAKRGGAVPDLIALDFELREFIVVEISTAANLGTLITKINNRDRDWFPPIRERLETLEIIDARWKARFLGFVRDALLAKAKNAFPDAADVSFYPLEHAMLEYAYSHERKMGLPR